MQIKNNLIHAKAEKVKESPYLRPSDVIFSAERAAKVVGRLHVRKARVEW